MSSYCTNILAQLPLDNCYDPQKENFLWQELMRLLCSDCTVTVPQGTSPEDFACLGWNGAFPDIDACAYLTVIEGCNIWFAVNDPVNCDLGECPAVGGTGTAWKTISTSSASGINAVLYAINMIPTAYTIFTNTSVMAWNNIIYQNLAVGSYNNIAPFSRWTCNQSGFYRWTYGFSTQTDVVNWQWILPPGSSETLAILGSVRASFMTSGVLTLLTANVGNIGFGGPITTANWYSPYGAWGLTPLGPSDSYTVPYTSGGLYLNAGDHIDFYGTSSAFNNPLTGLKRWRFIDPPAIAARASYVLIERVGA